MPTIDEELIQNSKAVFHSKVEHTEDVTFGKNAEVDGTLMINSAKDLKTKDGTGFGETPFYELKLDSITDKATLTKEQGEAIYNNGNPLNIKILVGEAGRFYFINGKTNINDEIFFYNPISWQLLSDMLEGLIFEKDGDTYTISFSIYKIPNTIRIGSNHEIELVDDIEMRFINTINGQPLVQGGSTADIKVQSTLYRHTITIVGPNGDLSMNIDTESDAKMVSINDLIAKFKGNKLGCYCVSGINEGLAIYTNITFGTTSAECRLSGRNFRGNILTGDTLTTVFGDTMEVEDTITAM